MEVRIAQSIPRDAIHGRSGYDAAEGARRTETLVVRHDEQHVGSALGRYHARGPPGRRLRCFLLNDSTEFWIGRRQLLSVDRGGGAGRTRDRADLLSRCGDVTESEET